jgi:hypothetical protein
MNMDQNVIYSVINHHEHLAQYTSGGSGNPSSYVLGGSHPYIIYNNHPVQNSPDKIVNDQWIRHFMFSLGGAHSYMTKIEENNIRASCDEGVENIEIWNAPKKPKNAVVKMIEFK